MNRRERSFQKHVQTTHPMRANLIPTQQLIQSHPDFLNSFLLNHDHSQPEYPHISIYHLSLIHQISITLSRPLYFYNYPCPTNLLFFHPIFFLSQIPQTISIPILHLLYFFSDTLPSSLFIHHTPSLPFSSFPSLLLPPHPTPHSPSIFSSPIYQSFSPQYFQ